MLLPHSQVSTLRLVTACGMLLLAWVFMTGVTLAQATDGDETGSPTEPSTNGTLPSSGSAQPPESRRDDVRPSGTGGGSAIPGSPQEIVNAVGWPFAIAFGFASIVALWCGIERLVLLRRRRVIPRPFVDRFLQHLRSGRMDKASAIAVCQQDGSPTSDVFLHGVRKWGKPSVEIEQAVIDGGERQISLLKKRLRVLNGVATISPLIGLLGTVIGMIRAFNDIAQSNAMGQAEQLARGIAMALLTTAIGLFIAIPALITYMYLAGRIDALVMEMDRLGQELVHLISGEALRERGAARPTGRAEATGQQAAAKGQAAAKSAVRKKKVT